MPHFQIDDEIELRPFVESDAEEIFNVVIANIEHLHTFLHWATEDFSLETALDFIRRSQIAADEKESQGFGIFLNGKLVGTIGFVKFNWTSKRTEIGYWIAREYEGRGIITRCCRELINYAFGKLEMHRVEIRCATENSRSCAIPEKFNFKLEGILRQSEWRHTRFLDMAIYGMLKEEWENELSVVGGQLSEKTY
jgi:ribosomal-protein-serine acetyltransferase